MRGSKFHSSLNRPQLYAGVPILAFMLTALAGSFLFVAKIYYGIPSCFFLWLLFRWLTKKDPAWMTIIERYLKEEHVYDSLPRTKTIQSRPVGWGKGLPW
jgi:type IV secretory pathway TrbD component